MAFYSIFPAPGLPRREHRKALEVGPPALGLRRPYPALLRSAGFVDVGEMDATPEYLATAQARLAHTKARSEELAELIGPAEFEQQQADRTRAIEGIERGLLRRGLFVGRVPSR